MKEPRVIDANILLRFLTNDVPEQADRCATLLKRVEEGTEQVFLPDLVLADVVWTLEKFYKQPKEKIRELLLPVLGLRGIRFSSKETARQALQFYSEKNVDWTDAFVAAQMPAKGLLQIYSYDRDFDKLTPVVRLEP
ncbi:nucleotide-binding protein [Clostridiales bacterium PH28_bin88]|nr:nucleotide-binding protein [Clostridiales bacterium PH28_bin88]